MDGIAVWFGFGWLNSAVKSLFLDGLVAASVVASFVGSLVIAVEIVERRRFARIFERRNRRS